MRHILFIVDDYSGGAGNIIQLLATEYAKNYNVTILVLNKHSEKRYPCKNVKLLEINENDKPKKSVKAVAFLIRKINLTINRETPDIVISFLTKNNILTGLTLLNKKIPFIACERSDTKEIQKLDPVWYLLYKISYSRADVISVQFEGFKNFDNSRFVKKCIVNPNIVAKPPKQKTNCFQNSKYKLVSCGRLSSEKCFDKMILMYKEIHTVVPNTELHIYGEGPLRDELNNLIVSEELSGSAFIHPYTNDVYSVLIESDMYLMTSEREGFPNSLSEAMAVGLPSVSYCCHNGILELTDNEKAGCVVENGDSKQFIKKVIELINNKELYRTIHNFSPSIASKYSVNNVIKTWDEGIALATNKRDK